MKSAFLPNVSPDLLFIIGLMFLIIGACMLLFAILSFRQLSKLRISATLELPSSAAQFANPFISNGSEKDEVIHEQEFATCAAPFDRDIVFDISRKVYCGSAYAERLINKAIDKPEALSFTEVFEVARIAERLCNYAASLVEDAQVELHSAEHSDASNVFMQCRCFMLDTQHKVKLYKDKKGW